MSEIKVGSTVNVRFSFVYDNAYVDPDDLVGEIFLFNTTTNTYPGSPTSTFVPSLVSQGIYQFDWVPGSAGKFLVKLTGQFDDATLDIVHEKYYLIGDVLPSKTMDDSILITMLGELSPLYVDPEYIMQLYPAGDIVEITEIIWRKSLDLESRLGMSDLTAISDTQYDYVVASVMCELSRMYGLTNGGLGGFGSTDSFQLGDLRVEKGTGSTRLSSGNYDLGNATSWCELASWLRGQLSSVGGTFRPVVAGSFYCNRPVPSRRLKSSDV